MTHPTPHQIKAWVAKHFEFKVKKRGTELRICNPYDAPRDTKFHVFINVHKAMVNDFRPNHKYGVSGTFLNFVKNYRKISFHAATREVMGVDIDPRTHLFEDVVVKDEGPRQFVELPKGFQLLDKSNDRIAISVRAYLHRRMISDEQISQFGMGYDGLNVVFPYYEFGDIVYWQSRSITAKKFNFPPDSSQAQFIYGFDIIDPDYPTILTESIMNSLMFEHGVSMGSCAISVAQKKRLKASGTQDIIVAFDNDEAGLKGISKYFPLLKDDFNLYYSITDDEADWNKVAQESGIDAVSDMLLKNVRRLDLKASVKLALMAR
jgi:hypothetical protein